MKHTFRGVLTAWMSLIVLQTFAAPDGHAAGKVAGLLADVDRLVQRALDPKVPAIPDRRAGAAPATTRSGQLPLAAVFDQYSSQRAPTASASVPQ